MTPIKHKKYSSLVGEHFGNVEVLERISVKMVDGRRREMYRCRCNACGKEVTYERQALLRAPNRKSCGCHMILIHPGDVRNSITALMPSEGSEQWFCRCQLCGELLLLRPKQFRMQFDYEGCSDCRTKARGKRRNSERSKERKSTRKAGERPEPIISRETADINAIKEAGLKRGMSYGQYTASLKPVTVNRAPRGYTSWYERMGIK